MCAGTVLPFALFPGSAAAFLGAPPAVLPLCAGLLQTACVRRSPLYGHAESVWQTHASPGISGRHGKLHKMPGRACPDASVPTRLYLSACSAAAIPCILPRNTTGWSIGASPAGLVHILLA